MIPRVRSKPKPRDDDDNTDEKLELRESGTDRAAAAEPTRTNTDHTNRPNTAVPDRRRHDRILRNPNPPPDLNREDSLREASLESVDKPLKTKWRIPKSSRTTTATEMVRLPPQQSHSWRAGHDDHSDAPSDERTLPDMELSGLSRVNTEGAILEDLNILNNVLNQQKEERRSRSNRSRLRR